MNIFLAAAEMIDQCAMLHAMRYPFRLVSYYHLKRKAPDERARVLELLEDGARLMMDSGLFTYLFGGEAGGLKSEDDVRRYAAGYLEDMRAWGWKHEIVECDAHDLIGVEATHRIREEFFKHWTAPVLYVWHTPEGIDGLAELARTKARVALSVPELRRKLAGRGAPGAHAPKVLALLRHIRAHGPASVHLLGCTESSMMSFPADTCDSSSWISGKRYNSWSLYQQASGTLRGVPAQDPDWQAWMTTVRRLHARAFREIKTVHLRDLAPSVANYYGEQCLGTIASYWALMDRVNQRHTTIEDLR